VLYRFLTTCAWTAAALAASSTPAGAQTVQTAPETAQGEVGLRPGSTESPPQERSAPLVYTLERIDVRGNSRTRESVVRRYVPFEVGHPIDAEDQELALVRFRLLGTGYFRDVQLSLEKGSAPGNVVLVVEVVERNTVVVNDVWMGLAADADNQGRARPLTAFAGADVAETNLFGTGITLGGAMALAHEQLALRLNVLDPALFGNEWRGRATLLFNDAKDFFGNAQVRYSDPEDTGPLKEHAVVRYERFGGVAALGRDLSVPAQLWFNYRLEAIDAHFPRQASHLRGVDNVEPIDFAIHRGRSHLSTLGAALRFDTRDHPFLPTQGWLVDGSTEFGLVPLGSDYAYQRVDFRASRWWPVGSSGHALRLELHGGAIAGNAPFFERYFVGDYSDFLPSRILGVNFDRRPPPNFLGTQIVEVRYGTYAGRIGAEYRIPLYRGTRSIYGIDLFAGGGLYAVADEASLLRPAPGYSGLARIPIDLTANFGARMDTSAGGFVFALSNVLYFIPVRGEGPAGE
jgi:outer membrane protein assembly factor BamA